MTLDDLRTSLQNFMPTWCEITTEENGEIVIRTGLVEVGGTLEDMDDFDYDENGNIIIP